MNQSANPVSPGDNGIKRDSTYAWYVVFLLTFAYTVAYIDRQVLNLLVDPIKRTLLISDVEISVLQGFAFMAAYVICGPLFGRWVDTGHRRNILVLGVTLWSIFTVLCGTADSYWELFFYRAGVGAAEACLTPAGWSLIADYFTKERIPRAMSIFLLGPSLGAGMALIAGALVIAWAGTLMGWMPFLSGLEVWQVTFVMVGFPGILLALWLFTVKEPARGGSLTTKHADDRNFTLREILAFFWEKRALYGRVYLGMGMLAIVIYGFPTWMPTYLMRQFGANPATVGLTYGAMVLGVGALGIIGGPWFGAWLKKRGYEDAAMRSAFISCAVVCGACVLLPFMKTYETTLAVAVVVNLFYALPQAMVASALQVASPNRMRGIVSTLYIFIISVCGLGVAPSIIAFVTEYILGDINRVGESLAIVSVISALGATWLYYGSLSHFRKSIADAAQAAQDPA